MIYILTGTAKSGKTVISNWIHERYNISVLSTDHIMMMLHYSNEKPALDIDASDRSVSKVMEPYLYGLIKSMIDNDEDVLIEGVHFNPEFSHRLLEDFRNHVQIVYLGYMDVSTQDKVVELFRYKNQLHNPWIFNHLDQPIEEIVEYLIRESHRIYKECQEYDLTYLDICDINTQKEDIIALLMEKSK
ncbi:hypothetical protein [Candidatus Xianfuyuplasma coldseepsis]|uniref:UDP-N-acetylglucosamine kinase n=1 Tax=Candidatus Xianfuyuplasma coldseepsis TaxID=2782163 RepID=A0A7L7KPV1_9MOLU|nr:hypothetical protein [Xianfuyuplasma coldseepsis]QMS84821.1 hypothetical protein G4Z02_03320 [Xianfuyuplasma coldseepsis]